MISVYVYERFASDQSQTESESMPTVYKMLLGDTKGMEWTVFQVVGAADFIEASKEWRSLK